MGGDGIHRPKRSSPASCPGQGWATVRAACLRRQPHPRRHQLPAGPCMCAPLHIKVALAARAKPRQPRTGPRAVMRGPTWPYITATSLGSWSFPHSPTSTRRCSPKCGRRTSYGRGSWAQSHPSHLAMSSSPRYTSVQQVSTPPTKHGASCYSLPTAGSAPRQMRLS